MCREHVQALVAAEPDAISSKLAMRNAEVAGPLPPPPTTSPFMGTVSSGPEDPSSSGRLRPALGQVPRPVARPMTSAGLALYVRVREQQACLEG